MGMFADNFIGKIEETISQLNVTKIELMASTLAFVRGQEGRLFILGAGGSAGNASHAVNDFRKLANIECYCPTDNVSELTARVNDDGWDSFFVNWLIGSNLNERDALLILSVGGGNIEKNISSGLTYAAQYAGKQGCTVLGILGRDGGDVGKIAGHSIIIPDLFPELVTPISESLQSVILHLLVSHPILAKNLTTW